MKVDQKFVCSLCRPAYLIALILVTNSYPFRTVFGFSHVVCWSFYIQDEITYKRCWKLASKILLGQKPCQTLSKCHQVLVQEFPGCEFAFMAGCCWRGMTVNLSLAGLQQVLCCLVSQQFRPYTYNLRQRCHILTSVSCRWWTISYNSTDLPIVVKLFQVIDLEQTIVFYDRCSSGSLALVVNNSQNQNCQL